MSEEENIGIEPEKVSLVSETTPLVSETTPLVSENNIVNFIEEIKEPYPDQAPIINNNNNNAIPAIEITNIVTEIVNIALDDKNTTNNDNNNNLNINDFRILLAKIFQDKKLCDEFAANILPTININMDMVVIIYHLENIINDTDLFDIYKSILEILKDGKIDSKDIPQFIILIERIHKFTISYKGGHYSSENKIKLTEIFIKFLFRGLVEKGIIGVPERNDELIKEIDALIDSCIKLLNFSMDLSSNIGNNKNIFNRIKKLFSCNV